MILALIIIWVYLYIFQVILCIFDVCEGHINYVVTSKRRMLNIFNPLLPFVWIGIRYIWRETKKKYNELD